MSTHGDRDALSAHRDVVDRITADGYYPDGSVKMSHAVVLALHGCPPPPMHNADE
ncbi:hypothetical protein [uncultured Williamsia sp.]|uniref:hypothetical protein n=1 Tax=uncultured Williamsia sp. TaxID=259311 RepID=UPI0026350779|nr:hypothetical protein [uncultured Williamsia sp.]